MGRQNISSSPKSPEVDKNHFKKMPPPKKIKKTFSLLFDVIFSKTQNIAQKNKPYTIISSLSSAISNKETYPKTAFLNQQLKQ
jgi:hypothetical protein